MRVEILEREMVQSTFLWCRKMFFHIFQIDFAVEFKNRRLSSDWNNANLPKLKSLNWNRFIGPHCRKRIFHNMLEDSIPIWSGNSYVFSLCNLSGLLLPQLFEGMNSISTPRRKIWHKSSNFHCILSCTKHGSFAWIGNGGSHSSEIPPEKRILIES